MSSYNNLVDWENAAKRGDTSRNYPVGVMPCATSQSCGRYRTEKRHTN